jgi:hypothetical protein
VLRIRDGLSRIRIQAILIPDLESYIKEGLKIKLPFSCFLNFQEQVLIVKKIIIPGSGTNFTRIKQGWQKPGFLKKKPNPGGVFWVLLGFIGVFGFFIGFF